MDIVIPVKPGRNNEELRYAIRSFEANLPHGRIWIVGAKPHWLTNVEWIRTSQSGSKYKNTSLAMKTVCLHPDVSEDFIYCNDDFFVMQPLNGLGEFHRGLVQDMEKHYIGRYKGRAGKYIEGMTETRKLLQSLGHKKPLSYELHIPMVVNKEKMLKVLDVGKNIHAYHKRTAYGNLTAMGGQQMRDVKILNRSVSFSRNPNFLSTTGDSFRHGSVGRFIRQRFPTPSSYEPQIRRTK